MLFYLHKEMGVLHDCLSYLSLVGGTKYITPKVKGGVIYLTVWGGFHPYSAVSKVGWCAEGVTVHGGERYKNNQSKRGNKPFSPPYIIGRLLSPRVDVALTDSVPELDINQSQTLDSAASEKPASLTAWGFGEPSRHKP